jgi:hypothetical protein
MYSVYKRNTEVPSPNYCCSAKAISISYFRCVYVGLLTQLAMRMGRTVYVRRLRAFVPLSSSV